MATFSYIPDPPDRGTDFEPLLDELVAIFHLDPTPLTSWPNGETANQYSRCEKKRWAVGKAASQDLATTREHAPLVLRATVHDQCRSGIRQLVDPLISALGYRPLQEALIDYVETGNDAEKIGATMAMYPAGPGMRYLNWEKRILTPESIALRDSLADLRDRYRAVCLHAFVTSKAPETRHALSLGFTLDPTAYPPELLQELDQARRVAEANPDSYERLLQTLGREQPDHATPGPAVPPDTGA
ncbi:hypothetical protein ABUW04_31665 [Streptacidiphilus sp. N1-10]|uniref:Uncharacterized protein n=1 Tax=Streptacidiphilus jeojiensis TaxID=3229225 RepID=A0ABV6XXI2_9ACTN